MPLHNNGLIVMVFYKRMGFLTSNGGYHHELSLFDEALLVGSLMDMWNRFQILAHVWTK